MSPTAVPLSTADLVTSALPFDDGLRDAQAATNRALTALEDNLMINQHPHSGTGVRLKMSAYAWI